MLQPKCRQPYVHNDRKSDSNMTNNDISISKLPPRPPLPKDAQISTTLDKDLAKQQQLSDWYYIKTGPKSPLPTVRSEKRMNIHNFTTAPDIPNISNQAKYYENTSNLTDKKIISEGMLVHCRNENTVDFCENILVAKTNTFKKENDSKETFNQQNVALCSDDIRNVDIPNTHQYSLNETLCKFNYFKWQNPQENRTPSATETTREAYQEQLHPFYYIETPHNSPSSPHHVHELIKQQAPQQKIKKLNFERFQYFNSTIPVSNSNSITHNKCGNKSSGSFEHINYKCAVSPLLASSEMSIDSKRHLKLQNYGRQIIHTDNNVDIENSTVFSSPQAPAENQSKVSI